ncbi:LysM peptidoglycan-binding domain-containing protein [Microbacterium karelineae]|uniref:LysM peptidoglycan-binding domain-containing protein n=1 Tax=Microbacterium karelineae TaxID=2654283 RepID=UPI0012EA4335|nr:LysM peptidoglycan-binding domain-containing protein [Microbacterium karelineae]
MSTVTLAAPATHIPTMRTRLRITRRGRRVLASLAAVPVVAALGIAILGGGSALGSDEQGAPAGTFASLTVMPGDSLWTIAQQVAPQSDPRDVVAEIVSLNQLQSSLVAAGQTISLPAEYSEGR